MTPATNIHSETTLNMLYHGALTFRPDLTVDHTTQISLASVYDAVIFDVDGTLVDSEPHIRRGVFHALEKIVRGSTAEHEFRLSADERDTIVRSCMGVSEDEMGRRLHGWMREYLSVHHGDAGVVGAMSAEEFTSNLLQLRIDEFSRAAESGEMVAIAGIAPLVASLFKSFGPMAINTGSVKLFADISIDTVVNRGLRELGLESTVVFPLELRTYSDMLPPTIGSKPHPLGYQRAIELLRETRDIEIGCDGLWNVLIIGDRANDMVAGLSAGARTFLAFPEDKRLTPFLEGRYSFPTYARAFPTCTGFGSRGRVVLASSPDAVAVAATNVGEFTQLQLPAGGVH